MTAEGEAISIALVEGQPPAELDALVAEALASDASFMAGLAERIRHGAPFLDGEGLFVGLAGPGLAAVAAITADPYVSDDVTGRLRWIFVREGFRRRGLAESLVRACLDHGRARWQRVRLHTDNPVAARLYARFGFLPVGDRRDRATHELVWSIGRVA